LLREAVLDYFSLSPFYDRSCINEIAKAKNLDPSQISAPDRFEYVLQANDVPPHLFVVHKQQRTGGKSESAKLLASYYVLDGTIYPGPLLHAVVGSSMLRCMHGVRMAFEALASAHKESSSSAQDSSDMQGKEDCGAKPDSRRKKRNNPEIEEFMDRAIWYALKVTDEIDEDPKLDLKPQSDETKDSNSEKPSLVTSEKAAFPPTKVPRNASTADTQADRI